MMPSKGEWPEMQLIVCLFDITENQMTLSKASQKYNIPKATATNRLNGKHAPAESVNHPSQRLADPEEEGLVT